MFVLSSLRSQGLRVKNLELEHFLLEPMQRVTRYPLLINQAGLEVLSLAFVRGADPKSTRLQILKYTEPDHPDHAPLEHARRAAEKTLNEINEAIRVNETKEKLAWLSDNVEVPGAGVRQKDPAAEPSRSPR